MFRKKSTILSGFGLLVFSCVAVSAADLSRQDEGLWSLHYGQKISLSCEGAACGYAGGIVFRRDTLGGEGRCMFGFLDDDTILTAAHCVPPHLKAGDHCSEADMEFFYRNEEGLTQRRACGRIEKLGYNDKSADDHAIIQLDWPVDERLAPARDYPRRAGSTLKEGDRASYLAVRSYQPEKVTARFTLEVKTCDIVERTFWHTRRSDRREIIFTGCDVRHGDSGSVMLNAQDEWAAIVNRVANIHNINLQIMLGDDYEIDSSAVMGFGQNLKCMENVDSRVSNDLCSARPFESQSVYDWALSFLDPAILATSADSAWVMQPFVELGVDEGIRLWWGPAPACFSGGEARPYGRSGARVLELAQVRLYRLKVNALSRLTTGSKSLRGHLKMIFDPRTLDPRGGAEVELTFSGEGGTTLKSRLRLGLCEPESMASR